MNLNEIDQLACIYYLKKKIFRKDEIKHIKTSYVADNQPNNGNKKATVNIVFTIEKDNKNK